MPGFLARPKPALLAAGATLLPAAALAPQSVSLPYDPAVFFTGACLSPGLSGCGGAPALARSSLSASAAVIDADRDPRLALDIAGVFELGPELAGEAAPGSSTLPVTQASE